MEMRYYTAIILLDIFAMLSMLLCVAKSSTLTKSRKTIFYRLFSVIVIAAFCEWMGNYLQGTGASTRVLHVVVKAVELSVAPSICFYIAWVIQKKNVKEVYVLLGIHAVLECFSGVFGFIYTVDANSTYSHGAFYGIYMLMYVIAMVYGVRTVLLNVKKYQYNGFLFFICVVVLMYAGLILQLIDSSLKVDYPVVSLVALMLYVFTLEMVYQTDELTELINRRGYENYMAHLEDKSVILFFDVDHFKQMNDTYGHAFGDFVLKTIGGTIKATYAQYGKCFRFGGDEFCVVLTRELDRVTQLNEAFLQLLRKRRDKESRLPEVSIGFVYFDPESQNVRDAVALADQMMYKCKEEKRDGRCEPQAGADRQLSSDYRQ